MRPRTRSQVGACLATALLLLGSPPELTAQQPVSPTTGVFRRFGELVVKVEVVEAGSSTRASLGSGFFVSDQGHVVTNYHVIAQLAHETDRYRVELVPSAGERLRLEVLAIDVVNDLALLASGTQPSRHLELAPAGVAQGERLYSLGHPLDLGLSIVEGTYNGLLQHTLYPKIHFTGSINPGMSGGPTLDEEGHVIGVNVSSAGDQVGFLVPSELVAALLARVTAPGFAPPADLLAEVGRQIHDNQDRYLADMFGAGLKTTALGPFRVLTEPAPFFRCWAEVDSEPDALYETVYHECTTDDYVFIAGDQSSGIVVLTHELVSTRALNRFGFHSLYGSLLATDDTPEGAEEHVTSWRCLTRNVKGGRALQAILCVRRYRKLDDLYDAVLRTGTLGDPDVGLISTLTLQGTSWKNVLAVTERYLQRVVEP